jgi:hypothetical protein
VGRGGFEPPTSPLSGVRSNQLSYRPARPELAIKAAGGKSQLRQTARKFPCELYPMMKGHEDDGNVLWKRRKHFRLQEPALSANILRKEVIQPQVPLRLPCYDFTPVAKPTVVACLSCELAQRLRVNPTPMV